MTEVIERRELIAVPEQVWLALTTADGLRGWSDCLDRLPEWLAAN